MNLSSNFDRTAYAVQRLQDENFRMKGQVARMEEEMFRAEAKKWEGAGSVLIFKEGLEADSVRKLADAVMNTCEGCCAVFSRNEDGSFDYVRDNKIANPRGWIKRWTDRYFLIPIPLDEINKKYGLVQNPGWE